VTLVDTSVWVDHLRHGDDQLVALLAAGEVLAHPAVIGELACGNLRNRAVVLDALGALPRAAVASDAEALRTIEAHALRGTGLGWVDVHLLAAALLTRCALWTRDVRLMHAARRAGLGA